MVLDKHADREFTPKPKRPFLISFSGMDGAGKTTQIDAVLAWLSTEGYSVRLVRFWDDIATLGWLRESASHKIFKSEKGIGAPGSPVQRRDKNVRAWYMTAARLFLYSLDTLHLSYFIAKCSREVEVLIFDRYLYDQLANLDLANRAVQSYAKLLMRVAPRVNCAFLLDADPVQAQARKPEYPIEFLHQNRAAYRRLSQLTDGINIIDPASADDVTRSVLHQLTTVLPQAHSDYITPDNCGSSLVS
jgi:thymidylate kinase